MEAKIPYKELEQKLAHAETELKLLKKSFIEISKSRHEEISLPDSKNSLKNYFEISPGIIAIANVKNGYFIECNQAVTRILGYSIEEFISKPLIEFIHPDDREQANEEITKVLNGGITRNFTNRYQCKDGSYNKSNNDNKKLLDEISLLKQISTELLIMFDQLLES